MSRSLPSLLLRAGQCLSGVAMGHGHALGISGLRAWSCAPSASFTGISLVTSRQLASLSALRALGVKQGLKQPEEQQALWEARVPELEARLAAILEQRRPELHGLTLKTAVASGGKGMQRCHASLSRERWECQALNPRSPALVPAPSLPQVSGRSTLAPPGSWAPPTRATAR